MFRSWAVLKMVACSLLFHSTLFAQLPPNYKALSTKELARKISAIEVQANAVIGVTAIYIEKNQIVSHRGDKRFFMASTIKLPIAIAFLHRVDENKESLQRVVTLNSKNSVPGSGALFYMFEKKAMRLSMQQILKYMLINRDNSASDVVLQAVKGPGYVTKRMYALGFKNMIINRSILEMLMDTNHVDHRLSKKPHTVNAWKKIFDRVPLSQKTMAWERFQKDLRDTTTPDDMAHLLVRLYKKELLTDSSTDWLLNVMERCRTGRSRIRGLLPARVKVAHKTGTWGIGERNYIRYPGSKKLFRYASDVGIVTLPNNKGHIAIAVYVKSKTVSDYPRSRAIALASRAIYDHFMVSK